MATLAIFDHIAGYKVCSITLPLKNGETQRLECVIRSINPPEMEAVFLPDQLPVRTLDINGKCSLTIDINGPTLSARAIIEEIRDSRTLILKALESVSHAQKREFFRIETSIPVELKTLTPEGEFSIATGEAVNISGSGILATFPLEIEPPSLNRRVTLNIPIPPPADKEPQIISCNGLITRLEKTTDSRYLIGFQFHGLREEDQDQVIAYCLAQQRQQLRLKIHIVGLPT